MSFKGKESIKRERRDTVSHSLRFYVEFDTDLWIMGLSKIELRIHEHTERGDNDTVKMPNGQMVVIDGKKCSDR